MGSPRREWVPAVLGETTAGRRVAEQCHEETFGSKEQRRVANALQAHALRRRAVHNEFLCDEEMGAPSAFALAGELVHHYRPYVAEFGDDTQELLANLIDEAVAAAPRYCPLCVGPVLEYRA